jgi:hypothetical protein
VSASQLPLGGAVSVGDRIDPRRLLGRLVRWLLLGALIASGPLLAWTAVRSQQSPDFYDFRGGLYNAGWDILHGRSFYQPGFLAHQMAIMNAGGIARGELYTNPFSVPVYPAFANLAVVPLALMPFWPAAGLYTALSIAAMIGALWLLDVRDPRCYGLTLVSWPFLFGLYLGAIGPFLVLGTAGLWRWRDRAWPAALSLATIVAAKIFPWTLGVWLWMTGRRRTAVLSALVCLALTFGAWALIGFSGLAQYPRMLTEMSALQDGRAISLVTVLVVAGVSSSLATELALVLGGLILALAWWVVRSGRGDRDGRLRSAFGLAVIAALTTTPIVWQHYMVLLVVPIAFASPRFSRLWLLPLVSPIADIVSSAIVPDSHPLRPDSPNALRDALLWLLIQAVCAIWLVRDRAATGHLLED